MSFPDLRAAPGLPTQGSRVLLAGLGCTVLAFFAGVPYWREHQVGALVTCLTCLTCGSAGALLATTTNRPTRRTGQLLLLAAVCWPIAWLVSWNAGIGPVISFYGQAMCFVLAGWAILAYPAGHLTGLGERSWVGSAFVVLVLGQLWTQLVSQPEWNGLASDVVWPHFAAGYADFQFAINVVDIGQLVLAAWYTALLWRRGRRLAGLDRYLILPVLAATGLAGVVSAALTSSAPAWTDLAALENFYLAQGTAGLLVPIAVLSGALHQRWRELSAPHRIVRMTSSRPSITTVRAALTAGLGDPSLRLLLWVPTENGYVSQNGAGHAPTDPERPGRWRIEVRTDDDSPLAIVDVDEAYRQRPELVDAVLRAGSQALLTAQLQAAATLHLQQILAAQARLEEKEQAERRRLERDLHEGAQRRLDALAVQLEALTQTTPDRSAQLVAAACHREALATIADLRDLASGLHPPVLRSDGLGPALDEVGRRLGLAVELAVSATRQAPVVEATAYFALCEALTNVAKYAPDATVRIEVTTTDGWLHGLVSDDGPGGARPVPGGGLAGIEERAKALRGWAALESAEGRGTRLRVALPCA